jgi:hypothetical protein
MNVQTLPDSDPSDSSETRWALETARTLWGQGDRREALQWVRRAAEAAAESGQDDRALLLAKQGAELRNSLDIPRTLPPPAPGRGATPSTSESVAVAATEALPAASALPVPEAVLPQPPRAVQPSPNPVTLSTQPTAKSVAPAATGSIAPTSTKITIPPPSERGDEIVVTVLTSDGSLPTPDASLVSRRAVRVAVIAVDTPNELRVRKLAPGEVAPEDSTVALLVAFEPGAPPVPGN